MLGRAIPTTAGYAIHSGIKNVLLTMVDTHCIAVPTVGRLTPPQAKVKKAKDDIISFVIG